MRTISHLALLSCLAFSSIISANEPKASPNRQLLEELSKKMDKNNRLIFEFNKQYEGYVREIQPALKKAARRSWPLSARFVIAGLTSLLVLAHQDKFTNKLKSFLGALHGALEKPATEEVAIEAPQVEAALVETTETNGE